VVNGYRYSKMRALLREWELAAEKAYIVEHAADNRGQVI
jgi:hypothetical protein